MVWKSILLRILRFGVSGRPLTSLGFDPILYRSYLYRDAPSPVSVILDRIGSLGVCKEAGRWKGFDLSLSNRLDLIAGTSFSNRLCFYLQNTSSDVSVLLSRVLWPGFCNVREQRGRVFVWVNYTA